MKAGIQRSFTQLIRLAASPHPKIAVTGLVAALSDTLFVTMLRTISKFRENARSRAHVEALERAARMQKVQLVLLLKTHANE